MCDIAVDGMFLDSVPEKGQAQPVSLFQHLLNERSYNPRGKDSNYIIAVCHLLTLPFVGCPGNCSSLETEGENLIIVLCYIR